MFLRKRLYRRFLRNCPEITCRFLLSLFRLGHSCHSLHSGAMRLVSGTAQTKNSRAEKRQFISGQFLRVINRLNTQRCGATVARRRSSLGGRP